MACPGCGRPGDRSLCGFCRCPACGDRKPPGRIYCELCTLMRSTAPTPREPVAPHVNPIQVFTCMLCNRSYDVRLDSLHGRLPRCGACGGNLLKERENESSAWD